MKNQHQNKKFTWGSSWLSFIALYSLINFTGVVLKWSIFNERGLAISRIIGLWQQGMFGIWWDLVISSIAAGFVAIFVLLSLAARKGYKQALEIGIVLYFFDGMLYVVSGEYRLLLVHAFLLWKLINIYLHGTQAHEYKEFARIELFSVKGIGLMLAFLTSGILLTRLLFGQDAQYVTCDPLAI